jgi:hypothetical protein
VVSLTAVFLALAIGLVVGTAALNGPVADTLKNRVDAVSQDNSNLRAQNDQLQEELNREEDFATQAAPALINGKLAGRRVLVVVLPTAGDYVDGVVSMLTVAGAKVTARVTVRDKFFDPANDVELLELADKASQPTVQSSGLPRNSDGVETSSALLGLALLAQTPAVTAADLTAVLSAYTEAGYLAVDKDAAAGAEATVVISGLPATDRDGAAKSQSAVTLVTQIAKDRPLVVAGDGIGDGNLVAAVRNDPFLVKSISTVDNASSVQGQLVTAMATAERLVQQRTGQYGLGAGSTSLLPQLAP